MNKIQTLKKNTPCYSDLIKELNFLKSVSSSTGAVARYDEQYHSFEGIVLFEE